MAPSTCSLGVCVCLWTCTHMVCMGFIFPTRSPRLLGGKNSVFSLCMLRMPCSLNIVKEGMLISWMIGWITLRPPIPYNKPGGLTEKCFSGMRSPEVKQRSTSQWGVHLVVFDVLSAAESLPKVMIMSTMIPLLKLIHWEKNIALNKNGIFGPSQNLAWYQKLLRFYNEGESKNPYNHTRIPLNKGVQG